MHVFIVAAVGRCLMLRPLHESVDVSHDPEKQYLSVSKFLKMTVGYLQVAFLRNALSNGGARSAYHTEYLEVPLSIDIYYLSLYFGPS